MANTNEVKALAPPKPPVFDGDTRHMKPRRWLDRMTFWFERQKLPEENNKIAWVKEFRNWLDGDALTWWLSRKEPTTWGDLKKNFLKAYEPVDPTDTARDRLDRCRQTTSVARYTQEFLAICNEVPDLDEKEKIQRFKSGLKPIVRELSQMSRPKTYEEWEEIAHITDIHHFNALTAAAGRNRSNTPRYASSTFNRNDYQGGKKRRPDSGPVPMEIDYIADNRSKNYRQRSSLTPQLRAQLLREGKCFNCQKTGHVVLNCPERQNNRSGQQRRPSGSASRQH